MTEQEFWDRAFLACAALPGTTPEGCREFADRSVAQRQEVEAQRADQEADDARRALATLAEMARSMRPRPIPVSADGDAARAARVRAAEGQ